MKNKESKATGCLILLMTASITIFQIVILTLKLVGAIGWSWLWVLSPVWIPLAAFAAFLLVSIIIKLPGEVSKSLKKRSRIDADAKEYGMVRMKGETDGELKKRIVTRNTIPGTTHSVSKQLIRDHVLGAFPQLGGCKITVDNATNTIAIRVTPSGDFTENGGKNEWTPKPLDQETLKQILDVAVVLVPNNYRTIVTQQEVTGNE